MTKQNIIDIVSEATGLTKGETEVVMNGVMKTMARFAASNSRVGFANRDKRKVISTLCGPHWGMDLCILRRLDSEHPQY